MKKTVLLIATAITVFCISCTKDTEINTQTSQHPFSEKQEKALALFHGKWRLQNNYNINRQMIFGEQTDTNVVVWKDDYLDGMQEKYQYQGYVTCLKINDDGDTDTYLNKTYQYYVNHDATYFYLYNPETETRYGKYKLTINSETEYKLYDIQNETASWYTGEVWVKFE